MEEKQVPGRVWRTRSPRATSAQLEGFHLGGKEMSPSPPQGASARVAAPSGLCTWGPLLTLVPVCPSLPTRPPAWTLRSTLTPGVGLPGGSWPEGGGTWVTFLMHLCRLPGQTSLSHKILPGFDFSRLVLPSVRRFCSSSLLTLLWIYSMISSKKL